MVARFAKLALAVLPAMTTFAQEHAAEGHEAHEDVGALATWKQGFPVAITALVCFALVFAVLATKVWPVIAKGLDERADKIRREIEAAELARKQAKEALDEYQRNLQQARAEAQRMIDQTKAQQAQLAAELKAKADVELSAMREKALKDIEAAKRAAVSELYEQSAQLATTLAGKILKRNITASDHQALIQESLGQLQGLSR